MTRSGQPLTLRLPFAMADDHWRLEQVLAADPTRSWAQSLPLLSAFRLSGPEKLFARELLQRKRNVWLFRCNQQAFCGDFAAIDMSARLPHLRAVSVIELKSGTDLKFGGAGAGNQLQRTDAALCELSERTAIITHATPHTLVCGDSSNVLRWMMGRW